MNEGGVFLFMLCRLFLPLLHTFLHNQFVVLLSDARPLTVAADAAEERYMRLSHYFLFPRDVVG